MTKKTKKLTTLACVALLTTAYAGSAIAQTVVSTTANVGVDASVGSDILSSILADLTGLLGGLGLGGL